MRAPLPFVVLALTLAACDSGGSGDATAELEASNAKVSQAITAGLSGGTASVRRTRPVYDCPGGGSVDVSQSGTNYSMVFDDCYDVSGSFGVTSSFTITSSLVSVTSQLDGDLRVAGGCDIAYSAFRTTAETREASDQTTIRYDGAITASCPSGTRSCQFDGVELQIDAGGVTSTPSFDAYCD